MIAVDTSALIAMILEESDWELLDQIVAENTCIIGAPTLLETHMVLSSFPAVDRFVAVAEFQRYADVKVMAFGTQHLEAARIAFERYGKGRNPQSALNYGDCLSYAVAKVEGIPLLFKGRDFLATDIEPAVPL